MSELFTFSVLALGVLGILAYVAIVRQVPFEARLSFKDGLRMIMHHVKRDPPTQKSEE